jgi:hypothetical protein
MVKSLSAFSNSKYVNRKRGALKLKVFLRIQGMSFPLTTSEGAD